MINIASLLIFLVCLIGPGPAVAGGQTHFRFGTTDTSSFIGRYQIRLLTEAFRRNGLTIEFVLVPNLQGLISMVDNGLLDGDPRRVRDFAIDDNHPNYIRIDEQTYTLDINAYSKSSYSVKNWADLGPLGVSVGYVQGIKIVERQLGENVPQSHITMYPHRVEALRALRDGEVDVTVIANQYHVWEILNSDEFRGTGIHRLATLEKTGMYSYFAKKHATLAPVIAKTLHQMKHDGTIQKLLTEVMVK